MKPTIGRIVQYTLTESDAGKINRRRVENATRLDEWAAGAIAHVGNEVKAGDVLPMMIVHINADNGNVNGQVFLDGNDVFWALSKLPIDATSSAVNEAGKWNWPAKV